MRSSLFHRHRTMPVLIAGIGAAALALAGCTSAAPGDAGSGSDSEHLRVVTTTTQLTDFAARVGGDDIELTGLLASGASAHHFDPTPADLMTLAGADVLIVNGAGLDEFIDRAVTSSGFVGTIIDASEGIDLDEARAITAEAEEQGAADGGEHDHAEHDHAEDAGDAEHDHDDHADHSHDHDHDHGDLNPHLWTTPRYAADMVTEIAAGLAEADPAHAADFTARAEAYTEQLTLLDEWIAAQFAAVPEADRVLVTGHDSLRYYLHDYDIAFAGALLPSFEDNAEPSAAEIDALVAAIRDSGVKAIFVESSLSPKLAQTVANEAGVTVLDADSLYVDSLGGEASGADTYLSAMVHNTRVILKGWGHESTPLPQELEAE